MPRFRAKTSAHSPIHSTSLAMPALLLAAIALALVGCATSEPVQPSAVIQPEPTGDPQMDKMLSMLQRADALESDSIDLAAAAAKAAREKPAELASTPTPPADPARATKAQLNSTAEQIDQAPETTFAGAPRPDTYDRPFATPGMLDDPDAFETQLANFNAPPGLHTDAATTQADPENAIHAEPPLGFRLADEIRNQPGTPFAKALAMSAISPLMGMAPDADTDLTMESSEITEAVYMLLTELADLGDDPDPDDAAAIARVFSDALSKDRPLAITAATLCTRVDGFGRYNELGKTPAFLAGKFTPVVVYVEVDHFAHAPVTSTYRGPDKGDAQHWEVRLSQEINLYRVHETVPVWTLPASNLTDISRNKRRDFHVTNQITLPDSLALGMYELKITMKDLVSGAEAEEMIPIQIVIDAGLLSSD